MLEHNGDIILDKNVFNLYEKVEVLEKIDNYNKNHGDDGKFSSGSGGSLSSGSKPGVGDSVDISGKSNYDSGAHKPLKGSLSVGSGKKVIYKKIDGDPKKFIDDNFAVPNMITNPQLPGKHEDTKSSIEAIDKVFAEEARTGGSGHRIDTGIATELFASTNIGKVVADLKSEGMLPETHMDWYEKPEGAKKLLETVKSELTGKDYTFKGYISTDSEKSNAVDQFASGNSRIETMGMETYINISSSKVKSVRVNKITGMDSFAGQENPENERLFNRDSKFEIYNVDIVPTSAPGYSGVRGEGFQLVLYMKDVTTKNRIENGGPGSGNHGHAGRPGTIGGSSSRGGNKGLDAIYTAYPEIKSYVKKAAESFKALKEAQELANTLYHGDSGWQQALATVEGQKDLISSQYRQIFHEANLKDNQTSKGIDNNSHQAVIAAQLEWSKGNGPRGQDGTYWSTPDLESNLSTGASQLHSAVTQAILREAGINKITLYRGQSKEWGEPKGLVSYTDSKYVAKDFDLNVSKRVVDVSEIKYHYLTDFNSSHKTESEIIIQR